jgi:IS5 family transposase
MLRIHILQNLYNLADEATACEVVDSRAFSDFCGVASSNQVPDGDTIGRFRNILVRNGLEQKIFAQVVISLQEKGLLLKKGTIVDSTFIEAPSSTKNKEKQLAFRVQGAYRGVPLYATKKVRKSNTKSIGAPLG